MGCAASTAKRSAVSDAGAVGKEGKQDIKQANPGGKSAPAVTGNNRQSLGKVAPEPTKAAAAPEQLASSSSSPASASAAAAASSSPSSTTTTTTTTSPAKASSSNKLAPITSANNANVQPPIRQRMGSVSKIKATSEPTLNEEEAKRVKTTPLNTVVSTSKKYIPSSLSTPSNNEDIEKKAKQNKQAAEQDKSGGVQEAATKKSNTSLEDDEATKNKSESSQNNGARSDGVVTIVTDQSSAAGNSDSKNDGGNNTAGGGNNSKNKPLAVSHGKLDSDSSKDMLMSNTSMVQNPAEQIRQFLLSHTLFSQIPDKQAFVHRLAEEMQTRIYNDRDTIIRRGETGRAMFFTVRGKVEVVSEDGETVFDVIKENSFFGEVGVLFAVPRTATVRAKGRCLLLVLTKDRLEILCKHYPEVREHISMEAEERFALFRRREETGLKVGVDEELKRDITGRDLGKIPLFRNCEVGFLHMLALKLHPKRFTAQSLIVQRGDPATAMYFIAHGVAEVLSSTPPFTDAVAELRSGSFFGEIGLLFARERTASVRAISEIVDCFVLDKSDFDGVLAAYPEVASVVAEEAEMRLKLVETRRKIAENGENWKGSGAEAGSHTNVNTNVVLGGEIEVDVTREKLKKVPLFKDCDIGFLHLLALKMRLEVFQPNTCIIKKDEIGSEMYFVNTGIAQVVSDVDPAHRTIIADMPAGSFIGEVSLFFDVRRTASVYSHVTEGCTVYVLSKRMLQRVLREYPTIADKMTREAEENYVRFKARRDAMIAAEKASEKAIEAGSTTEMTAFNPEKFEIEATVEALRKVPLFHACDLGMLRQLAFETDVKSYNSPQNGPQAYIFREGDAASEMFFVVTGEAEIVHRNAVIDVVNAGGFFGEIALKYGVPRTASVRIASGNRCDCLILSADALEKVLRKYEEVAEIIELEAEERYRRARLREAMNNGVAYVAVPEVKGWVGRTSTANETESAAVAATASMHQRKPAAPNPGQLGASSPSSSPTTSSSSGSSSSAPAVNTSESKSGSSSPAAQTITGSKAASGSGDNPASSVKSAADQSVSAKDDAASKSQQTGKDAAGQDANGEVSESLNSLESVVPTMDRKGKKSFKESTMNLIKNLSDQFSKLSRKKGSESAHDLRVESMQSVSQSDGPSTVGEKRGSWSHTSVLATAGASGGAAAAKGGARGGATIGAVVPPPEPLVETLLIEPLDVYPDGAEKRKSGKMAITVNNIVELEPFIMDCIFTHLDPLSRLAAGATCRTWRRLLFPAYQTPSSSTSTSAAKTSSMSKLDNANAALPLHTAKSFSQKALQQGAADSASPSSSSQAITQAAGGQKSSFNPSAFGSLPSLSEEEKKGVVQKSKTAGEKSLIKEAILRQQRQLRLWSQMDCWSIRNSITTSQVCLLTNPAAGVTELLTHLSLRGAWRLEDTDMEILLSASPKLEFLDLTECWRLTDGAIWAIGAYCPKLRWLDISHCGKITGSIPFPTPPNLLLAAANNHSNNGNINTGGNSPSAHANAVSGNNHHHHHGGGNGGGESLPASLPSFRILGLGCPLLETLYLSFCKMISAEALEMVTSKCMHLRDIRMLRCSRLNDAGVLSLVRYASSITYLNISDCDHITDRSLQYLASGLPRLTNLSLSFCKMITDSGLHHFATVGADSSAYDDGSGNNLRLLESLDVSACILLTDMAIVAFTPAALRRLKFISMRLCKNITDLTPKHLGAHAPALLGGDFTRCTLINPWVARKALQRCGTNLHLEPVLVLEWEDSLLESSLDQRVLKRRRLRAKEEPRPRIYGDAKDVIMEKLRIMAAELKV